MRRTEKRRARSLRRRGKSMKEIERLLNVSRSSVSIWVRDIRLTAAQKEKLSARNSSAAVVERRRESRLSNATQGRLRFLKQGQSDIALLQEIDVFMLGIGIYLGEGSKTNRGRIELTNTDPRIIQIFVAFLLRCCGYSLSDLHAHIGIHSHLSRKDAERYWSDISTIPLRQFSKTSIQRSKAGNGERDKLPFGTLSVSVYDTAARIRLEGWIQGIYKRLFPSHVLLHNQTRLRI
jgi:transcriptional regulator with XRE-family HTH domain